MLQEIQGLGGQISRASGYSPGYGSEYTNIHMAEELCSIGYNAV
jgi:hypothetical protein